jgi:hypothetical protein
LVMPDTIPMIMRGYDQLPPILPDLTRFNQHDI